MKVFKKLLQWTGILLLFLIAIAGSLYMIYLRPFFANMKKVETIRVDPSLTLFVGGGGNSGILTSDSLVIVIDTKMDEAASNLFKEVKQLAGNKPVMVINTHYHPDHCKGNTFYTGSTIMAGGNYTQEEWVKEVGKESLPNQWLKDRIDIKMGTDTVTVLNLGKNVHTSSDIVVYLHQRKMLFGGDVILNKQAPVMSGTADPEASLEALHSFPKQFDIQKVIPGHGAIGGIEIIQHFIEYFNDMKLAAMDDSKKDALVSKYKDWTQIPIIMSPGATISAFKKEMNK